MQYGYQCEDCETAIFPTTTRSELQWLKDRVHVAREVAKHASNGLDSWMMDGLAFLDDHSGHSIVVVSRRK
jgi:methionyl-tRNA synthetase